MHPVEKSSLTYQPDQFITASSHLYGILHKDLYINCVIRRKCICGSFLEYLGGIVFWSGAHVLIDFYDCNIILF